MKVLIFGSTGMLGYYVFRVLRSKHDITCLTRDNYDIESKDYEKLKQLIKNYDIIINCSGIIPQKHTNIKSYFKVNTMFPQILSKLQYKYNYKLIHITTDCVFDGECGNYNEYSEHGNENIYGISKSLGEPLDATVIRTSIVGEELFYKKNLLEWVKSNKNYSIHGYINHLWNGVSCLTLAKYINYILDTKNFWKGTRHIFSPQKCSKYDLCTYISQIYNLNVNIIPQYHEEYRDLTLSSIYSPLYPIPDIYDQLLELKDFDFSETGIYNILKKCRFCNNQDLDTIIKFNNGALAGGFIKQKHDVLNEKTYPLTLLYCNYCNTCLCKEVIQADELFTNINNQNYYYYSSTIPDLVQHFKSLSQIIRNLVKDVFLPSILEIGCNDGVLLNNLGDFKCIGVDPSSTIQNITNPNIVTYKNFFDKNVVQDILFNHGKQDIIVACNCLAHIDNISDIYQNIKRILSKKGIAIIEVHYMKKIIDNLNFDFIYHEHMSYYTINTFICLGKKYNFYIDHVEEIDTHGGSIRVYLKHGQGYNPSINPLLLKEQHMKYKITNLFHKVEQWKHEIKQYYTPNMIGYGASGRTNTILKYLNINFSTIFDDSKYKIGSYLPFFHTPIISSEKLNVNDYPIVFILAWPYTESIVQKHKKFLNDGGIFIKILPNISIISKSSIVQ